MLNKIAAEKSSKSSLHTFATSSLVVYKSEISMLVLPLHSVDVFNQSQFVEDLGRGFADSTVWNVPSNIILEVKLYLETITNNT
jgi:hypothetical protein